MPPTKVGSARKRRRKDSAPSSTTTRTKRQASASAAAAAAAPAANVATDSVSSTKAMRQSSDVHSTVVLVEVPADFSFAQAACSYGYYIVPPNLWQPCKEAPELEDSGTFSRPLRFGQNLENTARCTMSQPGGKTSAKSPKKKPKKSTAAAAATAGAVRVEVSSAVALTDSDKNDIRLQVERMFQVHLDLMPWFRLSPEAKKRGYGRLFRSPTLFEDMVKCITGCNMKFQGTIRMNKLLCEEFGRDEAFPTPEDLIGVTADDLKERAKVGYRGDRIVRLAQGFRDGTVDPDWLEAPERTREEVLKFVKALHGFGDYAAGNVVMLLGYYEEVPLDSETVRHFKDYHGVTTKNVKEVAPRAKREYEPYAPYQFLQYWYEMVTWYEKKKGLGIHLWDAEDVAAL